MIMRSVLKAAVVEDGVLEVVVLKAEVAEVVEDGVEVKMVVKLIVEVVKNCVDVIKLIEVRSDPESILILIVK